MSLGSYTVFVVFDKQVSEVKIIVNPGGYNRAWCSCGWFWCIVGQ